MDFRRRGFCECPGHEWGEHPAMRLINIISRQEQDVVCEVQSKGAPSESRSTFISDFLALRIVRNEFQLFISSWVLANCYNSLNKLR